MRYNTSALGVAGPALIGVVLAALAFGASAAASPGSPAPGDARSVAQAPNCGSGGVACYYVCDCASGADSNCAMGNDSAAGTAGAPWRSYEKARTTFGA
ncbi:MAG TPA: hypothetical protein VLG46_15905, partial [Anaerolineae bacterium]|nr:hypothetical protein [Anaerolineae bacterium]